MKIAKKKGCYHPFFAVNGKQACIIINDLKNIYLLYFKTFSQKSSKTEENSFLSIFFALV